MAAPPASEPRPTPPGATIRAYAATGAGSSSQAA
jgi:hypothetical protein